MEKELEKGTYVLQDDQMLGTVKIADDVVAMIANLAASEVDGVSSMVGNVTNELMSKVGVKNLTKGVKVDVFKRGSFIAEKPPPSIKTEAADELFQYLDYLLFT